MPIQIELQQSELLPEIPSEDTLETLLALFSQQLNIERELECSVRLVSPDESAELNGLYRNKPYATNVLSFPYESMPGVDLPMMGDLAICAAVVEEEAKAQHKTVAQHFSHLLVHGLLHLLGYDHISPTDATEMEGIEVAILSQAGISNPYEVIDPS